MKTLTTSNSHCIQPPWICMSSRCTIAAVKRSTRKVKMPENFKEENQCMKTNRITLESLVIHQSLNVLKKQNSVDKSLNVSIIRRIPLASSSCQMWLLISMDKMARLARESKVKRNFNLPGSNELNSTHDIHWHTYLIYISSNYYFIYD